MMDTQFITSTITEAHLNLVISNEPVSNFSMVIAMEGAIVAGYDGTFFTEYVNLWNLLIGKHFKSKGVELSKTRKADWLTIAARILDMSIRCKYDFQASTSVAGTPAGQSRSVSESASASVSDLSVFRRFSSGQLSVQSKSTQSRSTSTVDDSDSPSVKIPKLTVADKENVRLLYDSLDKKKLWHLSNGTIVEEKMLEVAMKMEHEHPCHSLIFDVNDKCWLDVFEKVEMEEIRSFRSVELPVLSVEVETYFQELADLHPNQLYKKVDLGVHEITSDSSWLQKSYRDGFRLLQSDFFPLESQTEGNVVKRAWSSVDSCFDFSRIKCVSKASADASNKDRCLSNVGRQSSGRKMDYLFTTSKTGVEVGCGECALIGGMKTTKELVDAGLKMPKVMKDMANSIFTTKVELVNNLCVVGYYIGADTLQLLTLDFPAGYVARFDGFGPAIFPKSEDQIHLMEQVLRLVLSGKMLMETEQIKIDRCKQNMPGRLGRQFDHIVSTFTPVLDKKKKRRVYE